MKIVNKRKIREDLKNILSQYEKERTHLKTEADVLSKIDYIFQKLRLEYKLPLTISKEETIIFLENKKGRIDTLVNSVVIEYKKPEKFKTTKQIKEAIEQAKKYMNGLKNKTGKEYISYITDSIKIVRIDTYQNNTENNVLKFDEDIMINMVEDFLRSIEIREATSENLVFDFADNLDSPLYQIASNLYKSLSDIFNHKENKKTTCLFNEWKELFKLNHDEKNEIMNKNIKERRLSLEKMLKNLSINNNEDEYKSLFCIYTTYALTTKLIAYHLLTTVFNDKSLLNFSINENVETKELKNFLLNIEDGKYFRDCGIFNLMEGDFFTWYLEILENDIELKDNILKVINLIQCYHFDFKYLKTNSIDMFRNLYEAFIPFEIRHALGEYFTPIWLSDYCYKEAKPEPDYKILDNCCGSGAFLISAINNKKNEKRTLEQILNEVTGIDINPLSALMARINYFLNISDLIIEKRFDIIRNPIVIPVYLADSCNQPKNKEGFLEYNLYLTEKISVELGFQDNCIKVKFPNKILNTDKSIFFKNIDLYEEKIISKNIEDAVNVFRNYELNEIEINELYKLTKLLIKLEEKNWNGIWARIIANRLCTSLLPKQDLIIGNPPWVKWGDLPIRYREELKMEAQDNNLFNQKSKFLGANSLNICSLVSFLAGVKYVRPEGKVVYLMPRDLIFQESYEEWRKLGNKMELEYCVDWEQPATRKKVFNDVSMPFMVYCFKVL